MATMNVSLPDPMKDWVEEQTRDGRYSNASDYVRHLIRRDQERRAALVMLQSAIDEGIASGTAERLDPEAFKSAMRARRAAG
ncbi:MAG: type II toxin-antitoxin system ParD family antitoxin [Nisaea sp.]|uniref:type II toxin-antitoxin system ParD family antitoxin n=1 Tax=Nisaea sp. TaxID=2024842 RepID=UPI001B2A56C6|nr:type II toxin-antitoxin system ParD family antitoxin [Nisaea sp.]MBO6561104.1 type II toxin-antitoxin system ParD family antitoxin [Nisaea sp.]